MWQKTEDIDCINWKSKNKREKADVKKRKSGLIDKNFKVEMQLESIGKWVGSDNTINSVALLSFICSFLFFSWASSLFL